MDAAVLIIAVLALVAATASLTLQLTLILTKPKAPQAEAISDPFYISEDELPPRAAPKSADVVAAENIIKNAELEKFDEMLSQPYTGLDEDFDT